MACITLSVGSMKLMLTADDLSRHPNSLLSSLFASMTSDTVAAATSSTDPAKQQPAPIDGHETATICTSGWLSPAGSGWKVDLEAMDFPVKHQFEVLDVAAAATLLHTFYKQDTIPYAVWEPLLDSCPGTASASVQKKHDTSLHGDVSKLLDYFNVIGPVTRWLPAMESLSLHQWRLLEFTYACHAAQNAKSAVDSMMAYKPHQDLEQPWHTAVFAVFREAGAALSGTGLTVHVLRGQYPELLAHLEAKTKESLMAASKVQYTTVSGPAASKVHEYDYGVSSSREYFDSEMSCVDTTGNMGPTGDRLHELVSSRGGSIGPDDCDLGKLLKDNLSTCVRGTRMAFGHVVLRYPLYNNHGLRDVPVSAWVLRW